MTERVDIANLALSWLGEADITSLEDDLERARQMRINYIPARDATLEAHEWTFATKRFIPGQNAVAPEYGAVFAYEIPPDCLRVVSCDRNDGSQPITAPIGSLEQIDWILEGKQILTNEAAIYCRGIFRVTQEGKFSPLFVHALAAKLAYLTALNLTASAEIQANMLALYQQFIMEAKTRDGLQGRSRRIRNRTLLKAR
jgi:hypothetical protein